jgi:hypothetical protein
METRPSNFNSDEEWANFVQEDVAQKRAATRVIAKRRAVSRATGAFVLIEGIAGLLGSIVFQFWVQDAMRVGTLDYGTKYASIYDLESIGLMVISLLFFLVIVAGVGFLKRERWAVYCTHICGILVFVVTVSAVLLRQHLYYSLNPARLPLSVSTIAIMIVIAAIVAAPLIILPIIPGIVNSTEPTRRVRNTRPRIG